MLVSFPTLLTELLPQRDELDGVRVEGLVLLLAVLNTTRGDALVDPRYASDDDLGEVRELLGESGVPYTLDQRVTGHGGAADLLDLARERSASVIVIGLRRRTPTGKLLFGSAAQQILLEADAPVLAVKP